LSRYATILASPQSRTLMMGNEAIARGALEAGIKVATGYPGTPSSEILEALIEASKTLGFYAEWSVNEKVAFEIALGAAFARQRSIVTMKAPGVNIVSDPIVSAAYCGVNAGMVIVVADVPGPHTTQTEQDSRWYGKLVKLPMVEPSTIQDAKDFTKNSFELSEELNLSVILRTTTRVNHTIGEVVLGEIIEINRKLVFEKDLPRYVRASMSWNRSRHEWLLSRLSLVEDYVEKYGFNIIEGEVSTIGVIVAGAPYNYVLEVVERLKLEFLNLDFYTPYPRIS